jgi:hypothetical protein
MPTEPTEWSAMKRIAREQLHGMKISALKEAFVDLAPVFAYFGVSVKRKPRDEG